MYDEEGIKAITQAACVKAIEDWKKIVDSIANNDFKITKHEEMLDNRIKSTYKRERDAEVNEAIARVDAELNDELYALYKKFANMYLSAGRDVKIGKKVKTMADRAEKAKAMAEKAICNADKAEAELDTAKRLRAKYKASKIAEEAKDIEDFIINREFADWAGVSGKSCSDLVSRLHREADKKYGEKLDEKRWW